jgi:hypothetical protein
MKYEFHPFTEIFPMMPSHEIDALAADIKKFGQRVPIVIYVGKILDGRNRYEACKRAKVEPRVVQFTKEHPKEYVASANLLRRHLSTGDRAKIAALLSISSEVGHLESNTSNDVITQGEAAKMMRVSVPSVQRAKAKIKGKEKLPPAKPPENGEVVDDMRGLGL